MPFVDDPNDNQEDNVSGATPLGQGSAVQSTQPENGAQQAGSAGSATMQSAPKKSTKASSGMFTNIQKYVEKNRPQAQKMAGAVTGDVSKQASEIRSNAEAKQKQQAQSLKANQDVIERAKGQAQASVNHAIGGNQDNHYQAASSDTFQDLMSGKVAGRQQVGDLNIAQQQRKSDALSQLAQGAKTEQGRRNLLGETFQKRGQYTRGQSGLDQLITSGDRGARESLIQGTRDTADKLSGDLGQYKTDAATARDLQNNNFKNLGGDIRNMALNPLTGIEGEVDTSYKNALANRAALLDPNSDEYKNAILGAQGKLDELNSNVGSRSDYANYLQGLAPKDDRNVGLNKYFDQMRAFDQTGEIEVPSMEFNSATMKDEPTTKIISGDEAKAYLDSGGGTGVSHFKHRRTIEDLLNNANAGLVGDTGADLYGLNNLNTAFSGEDNQQRRSGLGGSYDNYKQQIEGLGSADDIVQRRLQKEYGDQSYSDLTSGADMNKYETAGTGQVDKINALKKLLGQQDIITQEQRGDGKYASQDAIRALLGRYK